MNERAMQIYGIGAYKAQRALPTNAVMPAVMGALFLFGAWFGWRKYRQNGLNV